MEERLTVMKKVDEAASSAAEDEQRYKQLKKEAAELRLQAARREIELTKQQCAVCVQICREKLLILEELFFFFFFCRDCLGCPCQTGRISGGRGGERNSAIGLFEGFRFDG